MTQRNKKNSGCPKLSSLLVDFGLAFLCGRCERCERFVSWFPSQSPGFTVNNGDDQEFSEQMAFHESQEKGSRNDRNVRKGRDGKPTYLFFKRPTVSQHPPTTTNILVYKSVTLSWDQRWRYSAQTMKERQITWIFGS